MGSCKFKYPKMFVDQTSKGNDSYPIYKRRNTREVVKNNYVNIEIDEVNEYRSDRWVSPPEAIWRLFRFPISEMSPNVYRLQLHLDGQQLVSFKKNMNVNTIVNNTMIKKTMLTEFFYMNKADKNATKLNLLYIEFPEYFVWSSSNKFWTLRQRCCVVGRFVTCHLIEGE
uniref:Uncharacterized protein n=1 Tax=Nicotiana tabacum TaxID=4097 RepID=A0A1S3Z001_TOBAC|nr:PREDICTED: uncharacterized protein LOC107781671 [Nicotiana tabacum]